MKKALLLLVLVPLFFYGQTTNEERAFAKAVEAIQLMHSGQIDESIRLLKEAQRLDPERVDYTYELAVAHYLKEDYEGAIKILKKIINHKDASPLFFQLLGNSYSLSGNSAKAFQTYEAGLKRFPNSGILYLEKGNVHWMKEEFDKALTFYERGIKADPSFPSNYYRAAIIYLNSTEEVWGMIYGEIFMNLERNTQRTADMSRWLYETYRSEINIGNNTISVSFSRNAIINADNFSESNELRLPFGVGIYEPTLLISLLSENTINIHTLNRIRTNFIENYFKLGHDKTHPNILFSYKKQIKEAGHLEAYNYWILMKGDEDGFLDWYYENEEKWNNFVEWFLENPLVIDETNKFFSGQY